MRPPSASYTSLCCLTRVSPANCGAVTVLHGTSNGLQTLRGRRWNQNTYAVNDRAEAGDQIGWALAAGDFDADGKTDLAIGVPKEDIDDTVNAGAVMTLLGDEDGLDTNGDTLWYQGF